MVERSSQKRALRVEKKIKQQLSCLLFTCNLSEDNYSFLHKLESDLDDMSTTQLRKSEDLVDSKLTRLRHEYGISEQSLERLTRHYDEFVAPRSAEKSQFSVPRDFMVGNLQKWRNTLLPLSPVHALIQMPFRYPRAMHEQARFDWVTPETSKFESMAIMSDRLTHISSTEQFQKGIASKEQRACSEAALVFAFAFVEAFLNGLAAITTQSGTAQKSSGSKKSSRDNALLFELHPKDFARSSFVAFRDKALQYPRIAAGVDLPILTESNSKDLDRLLSSAKLYRDAIAHPNVRYDIKFENEELVAKHNEKLGPIVNIPLEEVFEIVDAAIGFVLQVDDLTFRWIRPYIFRRSSSGLFPKEAYL